MCDNRAMWNYSQWNNHYYHQYLEQHARMTQWIQNLHQNLPQPRQNFINHEAQTCCHHNHQHLPVIQQGHYIPQQGHYIPQQGHFIPQQGHCVPQQGHYAPQQGYYVPQQGHYVPQQVHYVPQQGHYVPQQGQHVPQQRHLFKHRENSRSNSHYNPHHRSRSQTSAKYNSGNEVDVQKDDDNDGSDGELEFNVDAILAFRATKEPEKEDAKSEESFEFVDTILDENFEFVELDDAGQMQKMFGRKIAPDAKGNFEYDREARILLFGEDKADRIAGLETSLEIMFDHINDLHQPVVYPHA